MMIKIGFVLCLANLLKFSLSEPPSTSYGTPLSAPLSSYGTPNYNVNDINNNLSGGNHHNDGGDHGDHGDHGEPKSYEFGYQVKDDYTGTNYNRKEQSDGNQVRGEYRVQLPDGRTQIVTYYADWQTGFHADVRYEGTAQYPDQYNTYQGPGGYNNGPSNQYGVPNNNGFNNNGYNNAYNNNGYNSASGTSSVSINKDYSNGNNGYNNNYNGGYNYNNNNNNNNNNGYDSYNGNFGNKPRPGYEYGAP